MIEALLQSFDYGAIGFIFKILGVLFLADIIRKVLLENRIKKREEKEGKEARKIADKYFSKNKK
ncbi:hypothetical protein KJ885_04900 [Patescibacteria group bacterium]|nr:hypothetical protein [Patescibacteria group bacterium]